MGISLLAMCYNNLAPSGTVGQKTEMQTLFCDAAVYYMGVWLRRVVPTFKAAYCMLEPHAASTCALLSMLFDQ